MTGAWSWIASWCIVLLISGLVFKSAALLAMGLPYLVFTLFPLWRSLPKADWSTERSHDPSRIVAGQPCDIEIRITNSAENLAEVYLSDQLPPGLSPQGEWEYRGECRTGQSITLRYTVHGRRGKYKFPGLTASVTDPMGLNRRDEIIICPGTLAILPAVPMIEKVRISPRRTRVFTGLIRSRESGPGIEFLGTRPFVNGDPSRHINWKASARWDTVITNLFEQERIADIGMVLDARKVAEVSNADESLFEYSIQAAAALSRHFLGMGNRVGLLIYGSYIHWTIPGYGKRQADRMMSALTDAELGEHAVFKEFYHLPSRLFPPESQVVLVSPLRREDVAPLQRLRALGYHVLIISPDPIVFEQRMLPPDRVRDVAERFTRMERIVILAKLRRVGIQVVDWDVSLPLQLDLARATIRKRR